MITKGIFIFSLLACMFSACELSEDYSEVNGADQSLVKEEPITSDFSFYPQLEAPPFYSTEELLDYATYYTENAIQIAIFKHGTMVFFKNEVEDIAKEALARMMKVKEGDQHFIPRFLGDGNYFIDFENEVFMFVSQQEIIERKTMIDEQHLLGLRTGEVLRGGMNGPNEFDDRGKISLYARSRMFMDMKDPEVILEYDPKN